jgi:hypothetical protein
MSRRRHAALLLSATLLAGCTKLLGIDGDYELDPASTGGSGASGGGTAGSASGGTSGASTGGAAGASGSGGVAGAGGGSGGSTGGAGGQGGAAGASGSGGVAGAGGTGTGGGTSCPTLAAKGVFPSPSTKILDDFNRPDGILGGNWSGDIGIGAISSNQLAVVQGSGSWGQLLYTTQLCADQEAYVTIKTIDPAADFVIVQLKMQNLKDCDQIEVGWSRVDNLMEVGVCSGSSWSQVGASYPLTLKPGDVFGGRARANGQLEVYVNGNLLQTYDVTAWPYYANSGFPGLEFEVGNGTWRADDFGGTG